MTKEDFERLNYRCPLQHSIRVESDFMHVGYGDHRTILPQSDIRIDLKFILHKPDCPDIETVALMYYQFNEFMKDKFSDIIKQYGKPKLPEPTT